MSLLKLQTHLGEWTKLERRPGDQEIEVRHSDHVYDDGSSGPGLTVVEVNAFPEAPPAAVRADVHFVLVGLTENFPTQEEVVEAVRGAFGEGAFDEGLTAADLKGGPSYITLGGWLGSQDLALRLIGVVELVGIAKAITPAALGLTGEIANNAAGRGMVYLGPWQGW